MSSLRADIAISSSVNSQAQSSANHLDRLSRSPVATDSTYQASSTRIQESDFILLGRIGEGQFGTVDAVRFKRTGVIYARKTINKAIVARRHQLDPFIERALHLAGGEYAPPLFVAYAGPVALNLVVEYAPCGSLWDRIALNGQTTLQLPEEEVRWWASQMTEALAWIHAQGYAHRDVKPHNCLLFPDGRLKITDFGSAAPLDGTKVAASHCNMPVGTPDYIAPEVLAYAEAYFLAQTPPPYSLSIDWWSMGATVFELLVGTPPFFAPTISSTYSRILAMEYSLPESSADLQSFISQLLCDESNRKVPGTFPDPRQPFGLTVLVPSTPDEGVDFDLPDLVNATMIFPNIAHTYHKDERWSNWYVHSRVNSPATPQRQSTVGGTPRSTQRRRPVTEARAFAQLLECVENMAISRNIDVESMEGWHQRNTNQLERLSMKLRTISIAASKHTGMVNDM